MVYIKGVETRSEPKYYASFEDWIRDVGVFGESESDSVVACPDKLDEVYGLSSHDAVNLDRTQLLCHKYVSVCNEMFAVALRPTVYYPERHSKVKLLNDLGYDVLDIRYNDGCLLRVLNSTNSVFEWCEITYDLGIQEQARECLSLFKLLIHFCKKTGVNLFKYNYINIYREVSKGFHSRTDITVQPVGLKLLHTAEAERFYTKMWMLVKCDGG